MTRTFSLLAACLLIVSLGACKSAESMTGADERAEMDEMVDEAIASFKAADEGILDLMDDAYGYAIFPTVAKGGAGVGGAHGNGQVYKDGRVMGATSLSQGSIGLQLGGQTYSELILFENEAAYNTFTSGSFEFAGQASAVAARAGASADAAYESGVMVMTVAKGGLMAEASIGGQSFDYVAFE